MTRDELLDRLRKPGPAGLWIEPLLDEERTEFLSKLKARKAEFASQPNTAAELRLPLPGPRAEIRGQVLGSDGKPAPDLFIGIRRIHADDDPASVRGLLREHSAGPAIRTDADGLFTLAGLAPGAYSLLAHTGGGPEVLRVPVSGGDRVTSGGTFWPLANTV